ncbi:MAG TPA: TetR family transcriptional regulator [Gaiellaceae bacterium]|nr:TetR family transcriptional regulator [Gaiellaceae bacterium]
MPKVSDSHQEARRRQILDAAARCFARRGFAVTTVREIYEEAGLSAGSVYVYFRGKDEIVEALVHEQIGQMAARAGILDHVEDPAEALGMVIRGFAAAADAAPREQLSLRLQSWAASTTTTQFAAVFREAFESVHTPLARALERAGAADPDALARVVMAALQGLVLQVVHETGVDTAAYAETLVVAVQSALPARAQP